MGDVAEGKWVGALMLDLSKAFDSISHPQLISELESIGCSQPALNWFTSFLTGRQQRIQMGGHAASWKPVSKGVPQGSPLSPLLFNIIVRHLPQASDAKAFQFADDLTESVCDKDLQGLSSKLCVAYEKVKNHCSDINLKINLSKTQLIIFKTPGRKLPIDYNLTLDNVSIVPFAEVTLLGVNILINILLWGLKSIL